jgi:hypothetical protein
VRDFNIEEYRNLGEKIRNDIYAREEEISLEKIEEDYWKFCSDEKSKFKYNHLKIIKFLESLIVQYAADIATQKYFTKQELHKMTNEENLEGLDKFNLMRVNVMKNSLLQFTKQDDNNQISGITVPWFYFGMIYSTFCWHTEDLYLYSLNYMHEGSQKIWYGISHLHKEKMDEYIRAKYYAILLKQPDLVHRLTVHINPLELIRNGIPVYRVVQNPGELIITIPKGYHSGFSTGLNIAEAVNFSVLYTNI